MSFFSFVSMFMFWDFGANYGLKRYFSVGDLYTGQFFSQQSSRIRVDLLSYDSKMTDK